MKYITGNLLDITRGIIVHGCNCHGVMGSGVARAIRDKYPSVFNAYQDRFFRHGLYLGTTQFVMHDSTPYQDRRGLLWWASYELPTELVICNAMTQHDYGPDGSRYVDYDAISSCFFQVAMAAKKLDLPIYLPLIGAGLGGGSWAEISRRIEQATQRLDVTVVTLDGVIPTT